MPQKKSSTVKKVRKTVDSKNLKSRSLAKNLKPKATKTVKAVPSRRHQSRAEGIISVFDAKGNEKSTKSLPPKLRQLSVNTALLTQAIRVYQANKRQGSAKAKTRGEVAGSTRKIYRQKGTGRARHGGIRAPIFVGGGIVFGPQTRDYSMNLSKKMKKQAVRDAFYVKCQANKVAAVDGLQSLPTKTKAYSNLIQKIGNAPSVLLVSDDTASISRYVRNITGVRLCQVKDINTYEILRAGKIIFTAAALDQFMEGITR